MNGFEPTTQEGIELTLPERIVAPGRAVFETLETYPTIPGKWIEDDEGETP